MKNTFKFILTMFLLAGVWSCQEDTELLFTTPPTGDFRVLTPSNGGQVVLNKDMPNNPAMTVTWDAVSFGSMPTVYDVEITKESDSEWSEMVVLGSGYSATNASFVVSELNEKVNMLSGIDFSGLNPLRIRVKAYVGTGASDHKYSDEIIYQVQPYLAYFFRDLFLVGPASSAGWSNNNNNLAMFRDPDNENSYTYTGYLAADALKLLEVRGQWQPQWGNQGGQLTSNPLHQDNDPDVLNSPSAGLVTFTANTQARTFSFTSYGGTATTYSSIGIIGEGIGGWGDGDEIAMAQAQVNGNNSHVWYINNLNVVGGVVKFRANGSWGVNWGAGTEFSGTGVQDGLNIPVSAGVYNVFFYSLTGHYMFIPVVD